jgi:hypothetical protein
VDPGGDHGRAVHRRCPLHETRTNAELQRERCEDDAKKIIATATSCAEYPDATILAGGTAWRVTGTALDATTAKVGVEAYRDHLGKQIILITIMDG